MKPVNMSQKVNIGTTAYTATADGIVFGYLTAAASPISVLVDNHVVDTAAGYSAAPSVCFPVTSGQQIKLSNSPRNGAVSFAPYL